MISLASSAIATLQNGSEDCLQTLRGGPRACLGRTSGFYHIGPIPARPILPKINGLRANRGWFATVADTPAIAGAFAGPAIAATAQRGSRSVAEERAHRC